MNLSAITSEHASATVTDSRWEAVIARDAESDGTFYYSVATTGDIADLPAERACRDVKTSCSTRRGRRRRTLDSGRASVVNQTHILLTGNTSQRLSPLAVLSRNRRRFRVCSNLRSRRIEHFSFPQVVQSDHQAHAKGILLRV